MKRRWALLLMVIAIAALVVSCRRFAVVSGRGLAIGVGRGVVWWTSWSPPAWTTDPTGYYDSAKVERWDQSWSFDLGAGGRLLLDTGARRYHELPLRWMSIAAIVVSVAALRREVAALARRVARREPGRCRSCRYDLRGLPVREGAVVCPECGTAA